MNDDDRLLIAFDEAANKPTEHASQKADLFVMCNNIVVDIGRFVAKAKPELIAGKEANSIRRLFY